jgi:hypothetical protein
MSNSSVMFLVAPTQLGVLVKSPSPTTIKVMKTQEIESSTFSRHALLTKCGFCFDEKVTKMSWPDLEEKNLPNAFHCRQGEDLRGGVSHVTKVIQLITNGQTDCYECP